jgi:RimJ/RimL family protein N-acetyltransferase
VVWGKGGETRPVEERGRLVMGDAPVIVLETDRLVLRRLTLNDAPFIVEHARQYLLKGPIASYEQFGFGLYLTFLKESGDPIGMCGLLKRDTLKDVDVGFAWLPAHCRQGFATEAVKAVIEHGRDTLGLKRIVAITSPDNDASIGVLKKVGLRFEGEIRLGDDPREVKLFGIDF